MTPQRAQTWLKGASIAVIGFGLLILGAAHPATGGLTVFFTDLIIWPLDGGQSLALTEQRLLAAILGGVMAGWGVILYGLATALTEAPDAIRKLILMSIGTWFVLDSLGSVISGAPLNVLGNLGFLALFAVPLMRMQASSPAAA